MFTRDGKIELEASVSFGLFVFVVLYVFGWGFRGYIRDSFKEYFPFCIRKDQTLSSAL